MIDLSLYFISLASAVPAVVILAGYLNTYAFKNASSTVHQIVSWGAALAVSMLGNYLNLGFLADLSLGWTLIYGAALGLVSNGVFDIALVQAFLELIKARKVSGK